MHVIKRGNNDGVMRLLLQFYNKKLEQNLKKN